MYRGILLLGPTGSGKTPLGKHLEQHGLDGRRCWHFDFGANLRSILTAETLSLQRNPWTVEEVRFINSVLESGALLEDKDFPLARKILDMFIRRHNITDQDIIVLNGLPRHIGQAQMMSEFIQVELVVHLTATPEVLYERIRTNAGGDRGNRTDDGIEDIRKKIAIFNARTAPLIEYYRQQGVRVETVTTDLNTAIADIRHRLNNQCQ